ncbi:hypothetical protein FACS1894214_3950 [Planctomycetales bacterium]|nr:hypothetical protein FACS1894214_3950 [Planctomycetales bacterium]
MNREKLKAFADQNAQKLENLMIALKALIDSLPDDLSDWGTDDDGKPVDYVDILEVLETDFIPSDVPYGIQRTMPKGTSPV